MCLYRGELDAELSEVAPYLVALQPDSPVFEWFVGGLGNHFRKFLMVYDENSKPVYFHFYDPRVFRAYLPACSADESQMFFGPVVKYFAESDVSGELLCFYPDTQTAGVKGKNK